MRGLKIIKLEAENLKRLKAVEITPEGNTVIISGKNAAGKSSVLDAIWFALGGQTAAKGTSMPIREGEKSARVRLDLGDLVVTRNWTDNDHSYLRVENKEGAVFKSPQGILDALVGRLSFDPLAFANMPEKEQVATLLSLVDLGIDPVEIDSQRKELYDERTDVNRQAKQLEGQIAGLPVPPEGTPEEEVNSAEILRRISEAQELKGQREEMRLALDSLRGQVDRFQSDIDQNKDRLDQVADNLRVELDRLREEYDRRVVLANESAEHERANISASLLNDERRLEQALEQGDALKKKFADFVVPDINALQEELGRVEQTNQAVRVGAERRRVCENFKKVRQESEALTAKIAALDRKKEDAIKAADFPLEGLGFDENGVTYRGLPLKQASSAEQLRVSLALAIAMNPRLRVIRITDGSLLDSENMAVIRAMADEKDVQIWVERVEDQSGTALLIEDGLIVTE